MPRKSRLDKPLEWYPWNPLQWQSSRRVNRLSWAQKGLYRELLDECYLKGGIPSDPAEIADLLGEDLDNIGHELPAVLKCFDERDGRLYSPAIDSILAEQMEARLARANRGKKPSEQPAGDDRSQDEDGPVGTSGDQSTGPRTSQQVQSSVGTTRTGEERTGQDKKEKTTTLPASGEAGKAKPGKRRSKAQILDDLALECSGDAIEAGKTIIGFWHKTDGKDNREVGSSLDQLVPRLDAISKSNEALTLDLLVDAGRLYCEKKFMRYKAAQHFYSLELDPATGQPPFREWAKAAYTRRQLAAKALEASPAPNPNPVEPATV